MTASISSIVRKKLTGAKVGIPARHINFNINESAPRYFYGDNATATLFFAMLSAFFPPGERFFMESVRHFRDQVDDETLKAEISGFMGQEAIHGREHDRLNELLAERGFDMKAPEKFVKMGLSILEKLPASTQLAATTYMEHFTALLGEQLLNDSEFQAKADPEMIKIWQWHALEELEHKNVAYDVYETIGNSQMERFLAMVASNAVLLPMLTVTWGWMVAKEGKLGSLSDNLKGLNMLFGRRGFVTQILPKMPLFNFKRFHPKTHDTTELENVWREKLFGDQGVLLDEFKNKEAIQNASAI
tara:strand:- start:46140 stop:47045 length:906 start_codon:yes stop_codon:yes gene_type:complete